MPKIVLYIAMSLDGFIADQNGGVDWLMGQNKESETEGSYPVFIETVDTVLLGYTTYHQIVTELSPAVWIYEGKQSYVFTHRKLEDEDGITFINEDISAFAKKLKQQDGKDIWVCGGSSLVQPLIKDNLIDRYHISVIPVILGSGIPLFGKESKTVLLKQVKTESYNGITDLVYERREV